MGKCNNYDFKKCKQLVRKCEKKDHICSCGKKIEKEVKKDPRIHKEDLLWSFFTFKMITEVLADNSMRQKLKSTKLTTEEGPEKMLEFGSLQEALGIKKGLINPTATPATGGASTIKPTAGAAPPKPAKTGGVPSPKAPSK